VKQLIYVVISLVFASVSVYAAQSADNSVFYDANKEIAIKADLFEFESDEQRQRATELARQLRCPQCQNQNLIESNSPIAKDLRLRVFEMMKDGATEQEVVDFMTKRFGEFVLYDPVVSPKTSVLWFLPLIILVFAIYLAARTVVRSK
jgi:cytochrome c-type biogenesis protein CcmH